MKQITKKQTKNIKTIRRKMATNKHQAVYDVVTFYSYTIAATSLFFVTRIS